MSDLSTYLANEILDWIKGGAMPTAPAGIYVALYNGDPGDAGTAGTDVTTDVRAAGRVAVTFGSVASRAMSNSADVSFGASVSAVTVTHFGLWDASSAGNFIGGDALDTTRIIAIGDPVSFLIGDLSVTFAT